MPEPTLPGTDAATPAGRLCALLALLLGAMPLGTPSLLAAEPLRQVPAVLHVHSAWSSGDETLDQLMARARGAGVEALFLAENHLLRFEYGLPPLRHLLRYRVEYPSLLSRGPEPFLKAVGESNARQGDVLLVPGAEVTPHYYWTGNLLRGTLTMHDAQKNLLVFGLARAEDYRELPAVGNPGAARWGPASLWLLSPALLTVPGVWLLRTRRRRVVRLQYVRVTEERGLTGYGLLCLAAAAILLANNYPFRPAPVSPYDAAAGLRPHQAVIDFVASRGGLTAWSLPEARDHQVVAVAGLQATVRTDPYPDDLLRTDRFTAFGGLYEDTTTFADPGGGWDRLLTDFLLGRRTAPAWAIGEAAYHRQGQAGKRFGEVQTVLLVPRKDPSTLLQALRTGRMYALQRTAEVGLVLDRFQVFLPDRPPAGAGDVVNLPRGGRPEVQVAIRATDGRRLPVEARLVRSGKVVQNLRGETPLLFRWREPKPTSDTSLFYRLEARGDPGHRILGNPIFLRAAREGTP